MITMAKLPPYMDVMMQLMNHQLLDLTRDVEVDDVDTSMYWERLT